MPEASFFGQALPQKCDQEPDDHQDDRASEPEDTRCAPAASSGVAVTNERFSCGALTTHRRRKRAGAAVVAATGPPSQ
jgi:hypothetical protein